MTDISLPISDKRLVAPLRHTVFLLLIILLITLLGFYSQRNALTSATAISQGGKAYLYLSVIALQYGLFRFIVIGLRRGGTTLGSVIGGKEISFRSVGLDFVIAGVFWAACAGISILIKTWLGAVDNHAAGLLPHGILDSVLWVCVSVAAGFVEELCYRGYLQKQILALSNNAAIAILAQAVLFAISHSYQGLQSTIIIFVYGVLFGLLAYWRDSLRPGIIAHAVTDIVGGLVRG